jgi:hypothetical protein
VSAGGSDRDVIFEITRVGDVQRIAAVDVATGVEVVVQAPASAALADVRALALKKLERVLTEQPQTPKRPGTLA